ncbi:MAG: hypothetical protein SCALA702_03500 [Melioribacteraceae bacterium]|nr:MAG: hypothetical protein SCALA702_03500 [Melioribacteraceae bacterium]
MKFNFRALLIFITIFTSYSDASNYPHNLIYIHPKPGANDISTQSHLLFKVDENKYQEFPAIDYVIHVEGSESGKHQINYVVSDNTLSLKSVENFLPGEIVSVKIEYNNTTYKYSFTVTEIREYDPEVFKKRDCETNDSPLQNTPNTAGVARVINGVAIPSDFPTFSYSIYDEQKVAPGKIFLNNWMGNPYIAILNNDGSPYFYQKVNDRSRDFKVQKNGMLTRRLRNSEYGFLAMDSSYNRIDSFKCVNGYEVDEHELYMTEDGHYFMIALGYRTVDMSQIVPGGNSNATVVDNHIQEFDENHNLVFEWLSFDHFNIADAVHENLQASFIDYVHMNSIAVDYDDNIIISSRHLDEVTKIDRQTGEIIWRMSGENNQFQFINDNDMLGYQHFARPVEGSPDSYIVFDNGNYRPQLYTRAVEFKVDTTNMTIEKVWEFRHDPEIYTWWMGNAQRLPNGNTFINYANGGMPKAVEVTPEGEVVYEGDFDDYYHCYRAFRYEWESEDDTPYLVVEPLPANVTLVCNHFGKEDVQKYIIYRGTNPNYLFPIDTVETQIVALTELINHATYYFAIRSVDNSGIESEMSNIVSAYVNIIPAGTNYIQNWNFSNGQANWGFETYGFAQAQGFVNGGEYVFDISNGGEAAWNIQLTQGNLPVIKGRKYILEFDARAAQNRTIEVKIEKNGDPWTNYSKTSTVIIKRQMEHHTFEFEMTDETDYQARISFNCGVYDDNVYIDNINFAEVPTTGVETEPTVVERFELLGNYPNPFNPSTKIKFRTPGAGYVTVRVYNPTGEEVKELNKDVTGQGIHEVYFATFELASGVYIYTVDFKGDKLNQRSSGKMVLLK